MTLPSYDKTKRRNTSFPQLPKGAYVLRILNAKEDTWQSGDPCIKIAFDIAEGEYMNFYKKIFENMKSEDKSWPFDAVFTLSVPTDKSKDYVWTNWNTFFADLEDSNDGFVFKGDLKALKGRLIGGLFRIRQSEKNGNVYDHTEMYWSASVDDVRSGNYGRLPKDKLVTPSGSSAPGPDDFMYLPEDSDDEMPFK